MSVSVRGVAKSYAKGAVPVLTELDLSVSTGELLVLAGRSGCGKTTALRLIGGLEVPDGGQIHVGGRTVASTSTWVPPEERSVGLVFQHHALFPHLTVRRNVAFGLSHLGRKDREYRVNELLEMVGVTEEADRYPDEISGGQKQRVALARALAPRPAAVLLDEPFNNLDPATKRILMDDVKSVLSESAAILVTHDSEEATRMGDRIAYLSDGRVLQSGTVEELYSSPESLEVAEYLGPVNRIPGVISNAGIETPVGSFRTNVGDVAGRGPRRGWVLFRPEHLYVCPLRGESQAAKSFGYCDDFGGSSCCLRGTVLESKVCGDHRRLVVKLFSSGQADIGPVTVRSRVEEPYTVGDRVMVTAPFDRMGWAE